VSGGESTTRGFLDAGILTPGRDCGEDIPYQRPASPVPRLGQRIATPGREAEVRRGAPARTILNSIWSIGNGKCGAIRSQTSRGLDSLFTSSVLAIRPKTGELVCYFQYTPNDIYDVDATDENVLADIPVDGQLRKVMIQANKNGFMYVLDARMQTDSRAPLRQGQLGHGIDLGTGRPVLTDVHKRFLAGEEVEIWPSRGTNAVPIAFNPNTGFVYASTWNVRVYSSSRRRSRQSLAGPRPASTAGFLKLSKAMSSVTSWQSIH